MNRLRTHTVYRPVHDSKPAMTVSLFHHLIP